MRKADSLRAWLTAYIPELKTHPDRLQIYVEGGAPRTRQSATLSFSYAYTLKVGIWEFAGDADRIMVPILAWIEKEQPQLLRRPDNVPFTFEAELLDSEVSDIEISIDLTENVLVLPRADGSGYDIEHPPEPDFTDGFGDETVKFTAAFAGAEPVYPDA